MCTEQKEAWMKQIFEVHTWRQVRRLAGAIVRETRDLGIKLPQEQTLTFEGQTQVDMRYVCLEDEENAPETSEIVLLDEVGSEA